MADAAITVEDARKTYGGSGGKNGGPGGEPGHVRATVVRPLVLPAVFFPPAVRRFARPSR